MLILKPNEFKVEIERLNHTTVGRDYMFDAKIKIDIGYAGPLVVKGIVIAKFEKDEDGSGYLSIVRSSFDIGVFHEIEIDADHLIEAIREYCKAWGDPWT